MVDNKEYPYVFYKDDCCRIEVFVHGAHIKRQSLTPDILRMIVKRLAQFSLSYQNVI